MASSAASEGRGIGLVDSGRLTSVPVSDPDDEVPTIESKAVE
jgi:hypothetical protein